MPVRDLLKVMFQSFFVIVTGVTLAMYLSCLIFYPEAVFSTVDIGGILLVGLLSDATFLVFCSRKELGKKKMLLRFCIHIPLVVAVVLWFAWRWNWINIYRAAEVAVYILLILGVYAITLAVSFYQDKKTADRMNDSLKERYHTE